jgi:predicted transcriptional regulator
MTDKGKKVTVSEENLVNLIYNIVEKTISERVEKGELVKTVQPTKSKKVTVTEAQLRALQAKGVKLDSIKKKN